MPRSGAVTRSMTRTSNVAPQSTLLETIAPREEAGSVVREDSPIIFDNITSRGLSAEPALFDDIVMFDGKSESDHSSVCDDNSMSDSNSMSDDISMMSDDTLPSDHTTSPGPKLLAPANLYTKNCMVLLELEQSGALSPGVLTISPSGELQADLFREPDAGTTAGFFPNQGPAPGAKRQISSWVRDYIAKELDVPDYGPPAVFRTFYNGLKAAQERTVNNHTVHDAASALAYTNISFRLAIDSLRNFAEMSYDGGCTDEEVWMMLETVKEFVGHEGEKWSSDVRMLVDFAEIGAVMKGALNEVLKRAILEPYTKLLKKMEGVSKILHMELERVDNDKEVEEAEKAAIGAVFIPGTGDSGYWD